MAWDRMAWYIVRYGMAWALAGIIGAGRIGQVHLDTLASVPGVKPVIISDVVEPVLKMVTEKYGVPKYTLDVSRLALAWLDMA